MGQAQAAPPSGSQAQQKQKDKQQEQEQDSEERVTNVLPIYGSNSTFNINTLLYNNIMEADYFKALYQLRTYHEIVGKSSDTQTPQNTHAFPFFLLSFE